MYFYRSDNYDNYIELLSLIVTISRFGVEFIFNFRVLSNA